MSKYNFSKFELLNYCAILIDSSGTVTRDAPDENAVSSGCWAERDNSKFFVRQLMTVTNVTFRRFLTHQENVKLLNFYLIYLNKIKEN